MLSDRYRPPSGQHSPCRATSRRTDRRAGGRTSGPLASAAPLGPPQGGPLTSARRRRRRPVPGARELVCRTARPVPGNWSGTGQRRRVARRVAIQRPAPLPPRWPERAHNALTCTGTGRVLVPAPPPRGPRGPPGRVSHSTPNSRPQDGPHPAHPGAGAASTRARAPLPHQRGAWPAGRLARSSAAGPGGRSVAGAGRGVRGDCEGVGRRRRGAAGHRHVTERAHAARQIPSGGQRPATPSNVQRLNTRSLGPAPFPAGPASGGPVGPGATPQTLQ